MIANSTKYIFQSNQGPILKGKRHSNSTITIISERTMIANHFFTEILT
ncbi:hypothetical protein SynMITS9220_01233 [Synechococcus sp. MIT S9220]|nr:hypothetical protein SynMITS9220_01233 [Synechococcus sp. MIT S9220]